MDNKKLTYLSTDSINKTIKQTNKTKPKTFKGRFLAAILDTYLINIHGLVDFSD